jgi:hypothetical protein
MRGLPSRSARDAIEVAVRDGAMLAEIERDLVDPATVDAEARAALWLYAWGAVERRRSGKRVAVVDTEPGFNVR